MTDQRRTPQELAEEVRGAETALALLRDIGGYPETVSGDTHGTSDVDGSRLGAAGFIAVAALHPGRVHVSTGGTR